METYLSRFFPHALASERRGKIIIFKKKEDKSLYNAWEIYKQLLRRCPMYGIEKITQMDIFYHAMNYTSKGTVVVHSGGKVLRKLLS